MTFFEIMRKTTIAQKVMVVGSIVWLLLVLINYRVFGSYNTIAFEGLFPVVLLWGLYWIIKDIFEKRKNKK